MKWLIWCRRATQALVVILFCCLPWLNLNGWQDVSGSLFAFDLGGIPFADPATTAQTAAMGVYAGTWPIAAYYIGGGLALVVAFLLGRVFCGWLCPYGFFSELVHLARCTSNKALPARQGNIIFWGKCLLVALCLLVAALAGYPLITIASMPGELSLLPLMAALGAGWSLLLVSLLPPLAALVAELVFGRRFWCQYVCPQSVFLGLGALPKTGLRIKWNPAKCVCGKKNPCQQVCSMNLAPRRVNGPVRRDCLMCGDCVRECRKFGGALKFGIK